MVRRTRLIAVLALLVAGSVIAFSVIQVRSLVGLPSDAYASDWCAIFVIEHLKSTENRWPTGWDELRDEFDRMAEPSHYAWTFQELQDRVDLDFDVTADHVREADPPLTVFELSSGRKVSYNGDPNKLIRHYLRTGEGGMKSIRNEH